MLDYTDCGFIKPVCLPVDNRARSLTENRFTRED